MRYTLNLLSAQASRSATQSHRAIYGMRYTINLLSAQASRSATQSYRAIYGMRYTINLLSSSIKVCYTVIQGSIWHEVHSKPPLSSS